MNASTYTNDDSQPETYTDDAPQPISWSAKGWRVLASMIENAEPVTMEIWFVDRRLLYFQFLAEAQRRPASNPQVVGVVATMGMPVYEWHMDAFDPETETIARPDEGPEEQRQLREEHGYERVWPWIVAVPGVWARMSDGTWKRLMS